MPKSRVLELTSGGGSRHVEPNTTLEVRVDSRPIGSVVYHVKDKTSTFVWPLSFARPVRKVLQAYSQLLATAKLSGRAKMIVVDDELDSEEFDILLPSDLTRTERRLVQLRAKGRPIELVQFITQTHGFEIGYERGRVPARGVLVFERIPARAVLAFVEATHKSRKAGETIKQLRARPNRLSQAVEQLEFIGG